MPFDLNIAGLVYVHQSRGYLWFERQEEGNSIHKQRRQFHHKPYNLQDIITEVIGFGTMHVHVIANSCRQTRGEVHRGRVDGSYFYVLNHR